MEKPIKQEHMKYVALVYVFIILMGIGIIVISYNAGQEKEKLELKEENERLHDREILRSMFANQKEERQLLEQKLTKILEAIGK